MSKTIAQQLNITDFPFEIRDKNSRLIYFEDSSGYWNKYGYDLEGNDIYCESSRGYWRKSEYDSDGNKIYYEISFGFWSKYEYDSGGNEIYYENSDGVIRDNRPKETITVNGIKYKRVNE